MREAKGADWMRQMRLGDFEAAWRVSDQVAEARAGRSCTHLPLHLRWVWTGQPLAGKNVLIRCYHGLGDTIQFIRYVKLVRPLAHKIVLQAQSHMIPLLRSLPEIDLFLPLEGSEVPKELYDVQAEVMELPYIFRTTLSTIPQQIPYLHVRPRTFSGPDLHLGLVWRGGDWDERRSIPVKLLRPLSEISGVTLHILQRGPALLDRRADFGVDSGTDNVLDAARTIAGLDLVISVDSMPAHLSGALAVPTWTLLPSECDWRWMDERTDSPWYPTMRLFRQTRADDWGPVVDAVADNLSRLVRHRSEARRHNSLVASWPFRIQSRLRRAELVSSSRGFDQPEGRRS